ncbi:hypothetical protein F2P79_017136, partial [Pimephales promelas]
SPAQRRSPPYDLRSLPGPRPRSPLDLGGSVHGEALPLSTLRARLEAFTTAAVTLPSGPRKKKRRSQRIPDPEVMVKQHILTPRRHL